jgi:iron complex transport system substrate-binding protein
MRIKKALLSAFLALAASQTWAAVSAVDDRGRAVSLARPAARIVSLAPHATELLFEAGAGEKLVGVSLFSDYPETAKQIARIGDASSVDLERVAALKPDLVVAWKSGNHESDIAKLARMGYPVFVTEPRRLPDIPRLLRALGALAGTQQTADYAAEAFEQRLESLRERYSGRSEMRVFYEIWDEPLMTVNSDHIIDAVLRICGGVNVFADAQPLTPVISFESVLGKQPQVILDGHTISGGHSETWESWTRFPRLPAVANGNLYRVNPELLHRQTSRILEGAAMVCDYIEQARAR